MPFTATDVQLEFVRIDPFVRTTLHSKSKCSSSSKYRTRLLRIDWVTSQNCVHYAHGQFSFKSMINKNKK
jgi:hypothetical protein